MISYYFGNKENLLMHLFSEFNLQVKQLTNDTYTTYSPYQKLLYLIRFYLELSSNNCELFRIAFQEFNKLGKSAITEEINKWKIYFYQQLQDILHQGIDNGTFYDYDTRTVYSVSIGAANEYLFLQISEHLHQKLDYTQFLHFQKEMIDKVLIKPTI